MIGETISHYKILEKLGEEGMGVVYKAEDTKLKRTVALKFLPPELTRDPEANERFLHEAQAAAALSHSNICTIYEINESGTQSFIAMEYIEGQSLKDKIAAGPLKIRTAMDIVTQAGEGLHEAHAALGAIFETFEWNWQEAEKKFNRAIELNPNYATGPQWYAEFLPVMGRHEESLSEMKRTMELDPLSLVIHQNLGVGYYLAHDYDRAIEQLRKTPELDRDFGVVDNYLYLTLLAKGMNREAVQVSQEMLSQNPTSRHLSGSAGQIYESFGMEGFLQWVIDEIETISDIPYHTPYVLASYYSRLIDIDEAFQLLEGLCEERYFRLRNIKTDPSFDNIRSDPRFTELLKKMDLD